MITEVISFLLSTELVSSTSPTLQTLDDVVKYTMSYPYSEKIDTSEKLKKVLKEGYDIYRVNPQSCIAFFQKILATHGQSSLIDDKQGLEIEQSVIEYIGTFPINR